VCLWQKRQFEVVEEKMKKVDGSDGQQIVHTYIMRSIFLQTSLSRSVPAEADFLRL
jgi:hypothetical protein